MKTKTIQVNGKAEVAYAIVRNSESITCDYSYLMGRFAQEQRDVFSIYFQNWKFTFLLECQPADTVLTLDNIARIDYELQLKHLKSSGHPELKDKDFERLKHADPPQFVFGRTLAWSRVVILLPSAKILKEKVEKVELPDGRRVKVKVPKEKTLTIEGSAGGPSPIKALTKDEQEFVDRTKSEPDKKPIVTFSENFLTVNCDNWIHSESRKRSRIANVVLSKLYDNYKQNNKPMPTDELLKGVSTERIEKLLNKDKYPQTFSLIHKEEDERSGKQTISLSDDYEYRVRTDA